MKFFRIPGMAQVFLPQIIWRLRPVQSPCVCLTFDDGPHPHFTETILRILHERNVPATFFIVGKYAMEYPSLVRAVHEQRHGIGLHSFDHQRMCRQSAAYFRRQLLQNRDIVEQILGCPVKFFRPPYGIFRPGLIRVCQRMKLRMVLWSLFTYDYDLRVSDQALLHVIKSNVISRDIIVFHDGHSNSWRTADILDSVISLLKDQNFEFLPLKE
ncbi:MAG: polysaccharide deacetylase family protein [Candidatus Zhuqueibacterota bacterium]